MNLGSFSVSLNVASIQKSKDFYEKIGFEVIFGDIEQKWLILKSGTTKIGLFEGMIEDNILTFNPMWDNDGNLDTNGDDIRDIYAKIENSEIFFKSRINDNSEGPNHFIITDPDGNILMFDQHV